MKRRNLMLVGIITALITVTSLNLIFGQRYGGYERGFGERHHCCGEGNSNSRDRAATPNQ